MSTNIKLPIGVENFEDMIRKKYYYVDKTLMIKELLDKGGDVNVFTRPRRFGKTLSISMLQYFFENTKKESAHVFEGLKISKMGEDYLAHQNKYPVIKLSLKGAEGANFDAALGLFKTEIAKEFERHSYLQESAELTIVQKQLFQSIIDDSAKQNSFQDSLKFLSECLQKYYTQKVIILIDEYDVPLEKAYFRGYYDEMVEFVRSLFGAALKTNDALEFAVITGCLRVNKESIFTGVNNLNIVSILSDSFGEYFGFTEPEVNEMLKYCKLEHKTDEMRDWYNGYLFGETVVYNPWSSIKYLYDVIYGKIYLPVPHWSNTSSNDIIRQLITIADDETKEEIEWLIQGKTITKPIYEDIVYADILKNMNNLWNFLYFTGYLRKVSKEQRGVHNYFELTIPNKEIQNIYERQIREWFDERVQEADMTNLYRAVLEQDVEIFMDEISELLAESISFMDSYENFYHGFLTGVLRGIKGYVAKSNRESGNGRGDIFLRPRSIRKPAIIIEVKVAAEARYLEKEVEDALTQIEKKRYDAELEREGFTQIIKYGIAFYRKDCVVKILE